MQHHNIITSLKNIKTKTIQNNNKHQQNTSSNTLRNTSETINNHQQNTSSKTSRKNINKTQLKYWSHSHDAMASLSSAKLHEALQSPWIQRHITRTLVQNHVASPYDSSSDSTTNFHIFWIFILFLYVYISIIFIPSQ